MSNGHRRHVVQRTRLLDGVFSLHWMGRSLTGVYHSAVGHAVEEYILSGRVDGTPEDGQSLGWVVSWQNGRLNSHSVTAWSGQFRVVGGGDEFITTTWLLTRESSPEEDWEFYDPGQGCLLTAVLPPLKRSLGYVRVGDSRPLPRAVVCATWSAFMDETIRGVAWHARARSCEA